MTDQDLQLVPRTVTVESNLKLFELQNGMSSGTTLAMTFDIPEGMDRAMLRQRMLEEKEVLNRLAGVMEVASGAFERTRFESWRKRMTKLFDQILKRSSNDGTEPEAKAKPD
jgi:hypothetical protein